MEKIFKVSEFNEFVNLYLGKIGEVVIEGEIGEIKIRDNKWIFATVKDETSSVDVFAITYQISGYSVLEPGMLVHVYGIPRLYQKTGRFSVFASKIVPAGEGALRLAFEKLKEKLEKEGLFDLSRKREIIDFPERIGLITAPGSAAYGDFIKILRERMGGINIYFYPVMVQGKESVDSIVSAFEYFNLNMPNLDALVLIRGGGSLEDLQSFNDERVARAIFSSKIPVVCGVGHEQDLTIADLVADLRASTPSNAAELLVRKREDVAREVDGKVRFIEYLLTKKIDSFNMELRRKVFALDKVVSWQINQAERKIQNMSNFFDISSERLVGLYKETDFISRQFENLLSQKLEKANDKIKSLEKYILSFDVNKVLLRGFSLTYDKSGKIIKSVLQVRPKDLITTGFFDGKIESVVKETYEE